MNYNFLQYFLTSWNVQELLDNFPKNQGQIWFISRILHKSSFASILIPMAYIDAQIFVTNVVRCVFTY